MVRAPHFRLPVWKNPLANCSAAGRPTTRADGTRSPDLIVTTARTLVSEQPPKIPIGEPTSTPDPTPLPDPIQ